VLALKKEGVRAVCVRLFFYAVLFGSRGVKVWLLHRLRKSPPLPFMGWGLFQVRRKPHFWTPKKNS